MAEITYASPPTPLGYLRGASTGGFSTLIFFALCWAGTLLGLPLIFPHGFITLFTLQPVGSGMALLTGGMTAFIAGALGGVIIVHCHNLAGRWLSD